jgi:hypothetical protein
MSFPKHFFIKLFPNVYSLQNNEEIPLKENYIQLLHELGISFSCKLYFIKFCNRTKFAFQNISEVVILWFSSFNLLPKKLGNCFCTILVFLRYQNHFSYMKLIWSNLVYF